MKAAHRRHENQQLEKSASIKAASAMAA